MANIDLVIRIPEELYNDLKSLQFTTYTEDLIKEGVPLPKGHGRLFDERDIVNGNYEVIGNRIYELESIIEADKGDTE